MYDACMYVCTVYIIYYTYTNIYIYTHSIEMENAPLVMRNIIFPNA